LVHPYQSKQDEYGLLLSLSQQYPENMPHREEEEERKAAQSVFRRRQISVELIWAGREDTFFCLAAQTAMPFERKKNIASHKGVSKHNPAKPSPRVNHIPRTPCPAPVWM
jgi:hypothetical protein